MRFQTEEGAGPGKPDAHGEVGTRTAATQPGPTFSRTELGAGFLDTIATPEGSVKRSKRRSTPAPRPNPAPPSDGIQRLQSQSTYSVGCGSREGHRDYEALFPQTSRPVFQRRGREGACGAGVCRAGHAMPATKEECTLRCGAAAGMKPRLWSSSCAVASTAGPSPAYTFYTPGQFGREWCPALGRVSQGTGASR